MRQDPNLKRRSLPRRLLPKLPNLPQNGKEATVNADGTYTFSGDDTLEGFTAGTYDILEILTNKGAGILYPSYITIDIQDSSGNSVTGDSWPKTYYAPGGTKDSPPVVAEQNTGAAGTITIDNTANGNARLNKITFSESDLGEGKTIVLTIKNSEYPGDLSLLKTSGSDDVSVANACFQITNKGTSETWYVKTNTSGVGYKATVTTSNGKRVYTITTSEVSDVLKDGTYSFVEDLAAMGLVGKVFPSSWTVSVHTNSGAVVNTTTYTGSQITKDANGNSGKSISGDNWPKTYYPGGGEGTTPLLQSAGSGAAGTITFDGSFDGNARLNKITFSESDLGDGKNIVLTINNESIVGQISVEKLDVYGDHLAGATFLLEWSADGTTWAPVTAPKNGKYAPGSCSSAELDANGCLTTATSWISVQVQSRQPCRLRTALCW